MALGLGASLALTSLTTEQQTSLAATDNCPSVNYAAGSENSGTRADRTMANLGAFTLGVLDRQCREGQASADITGDQVTYRWERTVRDGWLGAVASTYQLEVVAGLDANGAVDPGTISSFSIDEITGKGNLAASVQAEDVGTGWRVEMVMPDGGNTYRFAGNTGAGIADDQATRIVRLGLGITEDALKDDAGGNQQYGK